MREHRGYMANMRIAHFSDLHLLSLDGARMLDFANKRWIGGLNLLTNRGRHYHSHIFEAMVADINDQGVDHIICTGDLTNLAFEQEFRFARERFDRLSLGPEQVTVLPGNHDTYVAVGSDYFRDIFAEYHAADADWRAADAGDEPAGASSWPVVRVRGDDTNTRVALIGISTSRATPWFTAYGRVGDQQLERLATILADERLLGAMRIVALHHPPAGKAARNKVRGLRDWRALGEVLGEHGAELVIHGHEHRDMRNHIAGPDGREIAVLGVQSGTYLANKPHRTARYRIFEIAPASAEHGSERAHVAHHGLRVWDEAQGIFVVDNDNDSDAQAARVA